LSRLVNENTADFISKHPDRFLGWATVPLQDPDLAVAEAVHAIGELKLSGITMTSNVNGRGLDDERLNPFWNAVQELDVPIFIHPGNPRVPSGWPTII
jgi:predicted TIM-barrel fold metal-dependent hydrolase